MEPIREVASFAEFDAVSAVARPTSADRNVATAAPGGTVTETVDAPGGRTESDSATAVRLAQELGCWARSRHA